MSAVAGPFIVETQRLKNIGYISTFYINVSMKIKLTENMPLWGRYAWLMVFMIGLAYAKTVHEPWRDEADSWVVVRDATLGEFLQSFGYVGHPPLWYLYLLPFARAGLPYVGMKFLHGILAAGVGWLLLFKSPLPFAFTIGYLFSLHFFYQYGVVARGYMLMLLLLFLAASLFQQRFAKPLRYGLVVGLLFTSEVFVIIPAYVFMVEFSLGLWKRWRHEGMTIGLQRGVAGLCCMGLLGLASLVSLLPADDARQLVVTPVFHPEALLMRLQEGLFPYNINLLFESPFHQFSVGYPWLQNVVAIIGLVVIGLCLVALSARPMGLVFLASTLLWFAYFFMWRYRGEFWHSCLFLPMFYVAFWLGEQERPFRSLPRLSKWCQGAAMSIMACCLAISVVGNGYAVKFDVKYAYSGSKATAEFIQRKQLDTHLMVVDTCYSAMAVSAYLPQTSFWLLAQGRISRYVLWNRDYDRCNFNVPELRLSYLKAWAASLPADLPELLFLTSKPMTPELQQALNVSLSFERHGLFNENYYLYEFKTQPKAAKKPKTP